MHILIPLYKINNSKKSKNYLCSTQIVCVTGMGTNGLCN